MCRSSRTREESNRTLLAWNALFQLDLYRKLKEVRIDFRRWRGSERERIAKLGEAVGLRVEIDSAVPEFALGGRRREGLQPRLIDKLASMGTFLDAAAALELGRLRVMRRKDALLYWEGWFRDGK